LRFSDDFTYLDTSRWSRGDHMLGRSYVDPANVAVDGENLRIKLPLALSKGRYPHQQPQRLRHLLRQDEAPQHTGFDHGFLPLQAPDYESEIDIEVFNDSTRRIMFTTYAGGSQTHAITRTLPFAPTTGFYEYTENSVTFYADLHAPYAK
jgi:endo-1,3-1,4-beta-glycanase ExoK